MDGALTRDHVQLLSLGRHLRLPSGRKTIVGRNEKENDFLRTHGSKGVLLMTVDYPGPTTLMLGRPAGEEIELAARITAGYSDGKREPVVRVEVRHGDGRGGQVELLTVKPMGMDAARALMV